MDSYKVIGLMSGTSLDGLDIAFCDFSFKDKWEYKIVQAETIEYDENMRIRLSSLAGSTALEFASFHVAFGKFCGDKVAAFLKRNKLKADFIASHGHTIFHQPALAFTTQIGDGAALSVAAGLPVVCDFRSVDVALGGQGAPLVPLGDELLFRDYTACLNLGGIANISFAKDGGRVAFDISVCNILFNYLAMKSGNTFDRDGEMARAGKVNSTLLEQLNSLPYYQMNYPKSLGREDVDKIIDNYIEKNEYNLSLQDLMATAVEHVAMQIAKFADTGSLLITGGGAFNRFLLFRLKEFSRAELCVPDPLLVNYKEALIFAFLGLKRWRSELNCLKSVTGAKRDSVGGAIYSS